MSARLTKAEFFELRRLSQVAATQMQHRDAMCRGKQGFPTPADARRSIRPRFASVAMTYRCKRCGSFHISGVDRLRRLSERKPR